MTPRERWLAVLSRAQPDRVPMDYWTTTEADARPEGTPRRRRPIGRCYQRLHIDRPYSAGPRYVGPPLPPDEDIFGIRYRDVDYGTGSTARPITSPLASTSRWQRSRPTIAGPARTGGTIPASAASRSAAGEDYPIRGGGSEPFLTYKNLRGDEQAYMDLVLNPEIVHYCLDKLFDLAYENTRAHL